MYFSRKSDEMLKINQYSKYTPFIALFASSNLLEVVDKLTLYSR